MTAQSLLQDLATRGVTLAANGDHLDIDAPDDVLTDEVLATLKAHKAELLASLRSDSIAREVCPICQTELIEQAGKDFRHLWCPQPGHFDAWRALRGLKLNETDAQIIRERQRKIA